MRLLVRLSVIFRPARLKLKFKRGSLPPTMPLEFVGCIGGCDETLREILDLRFSRGPPRASQPASQPSNYLQASQSLNRMDAGPWTPPLPATAAGGSNSVTCNCGREAVLLTVRKEGPNQGRQFYKCSAGGCGFFLWAEAGGPPSSASRPPGGSLGRPPATGDRRGGSGRPGDDGGGGGGGGGSMSCLCSQPAVTRTVQKDGPNKGRQFHTCAKPREQQCGFFQWVDENVAPGEAGAWLPGQAEPRGGGEREEGRGGAGGSEGKAGAAPGAAAGARRCAKDTRCVSSPPSAQAPEAQGNELPVLGVL